MNGKKYFGKAFAAFALAFSMLLSGCSGNETDNVVDTSDNSEASTAELPVTVPKTETDPAQTVTEAETSPSETSSVSETETTEPAATTVKEQTAVKPPQTTVTAKPDRTTEITKPVQTTVTTPKPAQTTVTLPPVQTAGPIQSTAAVITPPPKLSSSLISDYTQKWWYNHLNGTQQAVYRSLFDSLSKGSGKCEIYELNAAEDDLNAAFSAVIKENPQFLAMIHEYTYNYFSIGSRNVVSTVNVTLYTPSPEAQKLRHRVTEIIAAADKYSSDYDRIKYVHDCIAETTAYDLNGGNYIHSAEGALVYRRAVCDGYAKAFMYIMQEMGIPCICVEGNANGPHTWNMVQLGGSWYHVDVTWDDPVTSDGSNAIRYDYFLVSDSAIRSTHSLTSGYSNPTAGKNYR